MYAAGKETARKFPPRAPSHLKTPTKSRTFLVGRHRSSSHCRRDRENPRAGRRESSERSVTRLCREPRAKGERGGRSYRNRGRPRAARLRHGNSRVHEGVPTTPADTSFGPARRGSARPGAPVAAGGEDANPAGSLWRVSNRMMMERRRSRNRGRGRRSTAGSATAREVADRRADFFLFFDNMDRRADL